VRLEQELSKEMPGFSCCLTRVELLRSSQKEYEAEIQERGPGWKYALGVTSTQVIKAMSLLIFYFL
jgi:hypothetical protein